MAQGWFDPQMWAGGGDGRRRGGGGGAETAQLPYVPISPHLMRAEIVAARIMRSIHFQSNIQLPFYEVHSIPIDPRYGQVHRFLSARREQV